MVTGLCRGPVDLALLIDSSGSLTEGSDFWSVLKSFVKRLIQRFSIHPDDVRVGMVVFSDRAESFVEFQDLFALDELLRAVDTMEYIGSRTNIARALQVAEDHLFMPQYGDRPDVPDVVVLITDGQANDEPFDIRAIRPLVDVGSVADDLLVRTTPEPAREEGGVEAVHL